MVKLLSVRSLEELDRRVWSYEEPISQVEFEHVLGLCNAFWVHQGEARPEQPHALLTSGLHSDGFINLGDALKRFLGFRRQLAWNLVELARASLESLGVGLGEIDAVVGSDTSATKLAEDVARIIGTRHIVMVKTESDGRKLQEWEEGQDLLDVTSCPMLLPIEELITTSVSAEEVRKGIARAHAPYDGAISYAPLIVAVDRSWPKLASLDGSAIESLFRYEIRNFKPDECQYCVAGSEALAPKANWGRLVNPSQ